MFDSFTQGLVGDLIASTTKQRLAQICCLSSCILLVCPYCTNLLFIPVWSMAIFFTLVLPKVTWSIWILFSIRLPYGTFSSLESHQYDVAVDLTCPLMDGEGRGDLQLLHTHFVTTGTMRSSHFNYLSDKDYIILAITFTSLVSFHRSVHAIISTILDTLPTSLLSQGHGTELCFCIEMYPTLLLLMTVS